MPSGGHNAKPASVLKLHGQYRADRHARTPVATDGNPLREPDHLGKESAELWRWVTDRRKEWLASSDSESLRALCEVWQLRCDVLVLLKDDPSDRTLRTAFSDYSGQFVSLASRFGLTPADRARIGESTGDGVDPAEEFLA